jgi:hypothetical protein
MLPNLAQLLPLRRCQRLQIARNGRNGLGQQGPGEPRKAFGFSLAETRQLFYGFPKSSPPSERWQALARRKIVELDELARKIAATKELLQRPCECQDLAECGRRIFAKKRAVRPTPLSG